MKLFDAHRHLLAQKVNPTGCIINGTSPNDWTLVISEAVLSTETHAAIGLHPWKVESAGEHWQMFFMELIDAADAVGEIGLDGLRGSMDAQMEAFKWQLAIAAERDLPVSIHCVKASEPLLQILKQTALPKRGFHLHAYSGSAEQVEQLADLGAYFSFNQGQLTGNAKKAPLAVQAIPEERLLVETDAPDSLQGETYGRFLELAYEMIAELRGVDIESLSECVSANFQRYFLDD